MTHPKTLLTLAAVATGLGLAHAAHAGVEWSISVGLPGPVPVQVAAPTPIYAPAPVSAPVFTAPAPSLPSIEHMQTAQQARIQWGAQVGLITGHEHFRLQQTQQYIEQQRQWAYADGWLTYDEHVNLINLLNGSAQHIERALANWQRVNAVYYPMPPVLSIWSAPRPHYSHHHGQHGQRPPVITPVQAHPHAGYGHRPPAPPAIPAAIQPQVLPPAQLGPKPPHGHRGEGKLEGRAGPF